VKAKIARSVLLIILTLLGITLSPWHILPNLPIVPEAHASPPNNPGIIGLFSESKKSNSVIDSTIGAGATFTMDVNVTDSGLLKSFDVNITFAPSAITYFGSAYHGALCPQVQGCIFDGITTSPLTNNTSTPGTYRLAIVDTDTGFPFVNGNGILFRVVFKTAAAGVASVIHISSRSVLLNPSPIPYNPIDGYFDSRTSPSNYGISASSSVATVMRKVSGQNSTSLTVSIGSPSPSNVGTIVFNALGLPSNSTVSFSPATCTATCTSIMTVTINGGPRGRSTTTPSGTYSIPIIGNSTASGVTGSTVRVVWLKLVVRPPNPPTFTFTSSLTTFTQEAGNITFLTLTASLVSGANDSLSIGNNCLTNIPFGNCSVSPPSGKFPLVSKMNVTTSAQGTKPNKTYRFNVTATTVGTYSEVVETKNVTIAITVLKTHDLAVLTTSISRNFAYNGVSLSSQNQLKINVTVANNGTVSETFQANSTAKTALVLDPELKWVDANKNGIYDTGETVVVDSDHNGLYGSGKTDFNIKFVDTNHNGHWDPGEPLIYDTNGDYLYTSGKYYNDTVILGSAPLNNTALASDPKILFVANNDFFVWTPGDTVFYDANGNGVYDPGELLIIGSAPAPEPVLVGTTPPLGTLLSDGSLSYVNSNFNGALDPGETIVYDSNGNSVYDTGEPIARGTAPSGGYLIGTQMVTLAPRVSQIVTFNWDPSSLPIGSYMIAGSAAPVPGEFNLSDNTLLVMQFTERFRADVNNDCKVNIIDFSTVGGTFGRRFGDPGFNPYADFNNDGVINIIDFSLVGGRFGSSC
jgi:Dockerin type I domain